MTFDEIVYLKERRDKLRRNINTLNSLSGNKWFFLKHKNPFIGTIYARNKYEFSWELGGKEVGLLRDFYEGELEKVNAEIKELGIKL